MGKFLLGSPWPKLCLNDIESHWASIFPKWITPVCFLLIQYIHTLHTRLVIDSNKLWLLDKRISLILSRWNILLFFYLSLHPLPWWRRMFNLPYKLLSLQWLPKPYWSWAIVDGCIVLGFISDHLQKKNWGYP